MNKLNFNIKGLLFVGKMSKGYFATTIIQQSLPFLLLPILTRYLSASEYGFIALFNFFFYLLNSINGSCIPGIVGNYFYDNDRAKVAKVIGCFFYISILLTAVLTILILVCYPFLHDYFKFKLSWMCLIPLGALAYNILYIGLSVVRCQKKVLTYGVFQISNTLFNTLLSILFVVVLGWSWGGRVSAVLLAYIAFAGGMILYLYKQEYLSFKVDKKMFVDLTKVVLPLIPISVQTTIISQVGMFFMELYFTTELLSEYSIGYQIAFCMSLLFSTLLMSWNPFLYEQLAKGEAMDKMFITRLLYVLFGLLLLGVVFLFFTSGLILRIMTTPDFYSANNFVPWLSLGFLFKGMYHFVFPILIKHKQQGYINKVSLINMIIMIVLNILFAKVFGSIGIAYAFCGTYFILCLSLLYKAQKVLPLPWLKALIFWK